MTPNHRRLDTLVPLLRLLSGDDDVQLRIGPATAYNATLHVVEIEEAAFEWSYLEQLALVGHEAAHVRLTHYHEAFRPPELIRWRWALNWLEDARVHRWLSTRVPDLGQGVEALERRAVESMIGAPASRAERFLIALRARTMGIPLDATLDAEVLSAIERCAKPAQLAIDQIPERDAFRDSDTRACSSRFVSLLRKHVLPEYDKLREPGASERRVVMSWVRWPGVSGPTEPAPAVARQWETIRDMVADPIARLVRDLRRVLPANDGSRWTLGHRTGTRLDSRAAMSVRYDSTAALRVFERQEENEERRYRIGIAADLSNSMAGRRMEQLGRSLVLILEATERLGIPTSLVVFGRADGLPAEVVKPLRERLRVAKQRIERVVLSSPELGSEMPTAAALDQLRLEHLPDGLTRDVFIVVTDGLPGRTIPCYYDRPTVLGSRGDDGSAGGSSTVSGWVQVWDRDYAAHVKSQVGASERAGAIVVGVGVGKDSGIDQVFPRHVLVDDAAGLPEALTQTIRRALAGGQDPDVSR